MKLLYFLLPLVCSYNLVFYPGSRIPWTRYKSLISTLEKNFNTTISVKKFNLFEKHPDDTIIIAHSFGGTFALIDAMKDFESVKGIVLLNSHFNTRHKMFYPGIDVKNIQQPVLTILGEKDKQLPIKKAIDDYFYVNENFCTNKYFIVNENFDHFTCLNETDIISKQITEFINNIEFYKPPENKYKWFTRPVHYPGTIDLACSLNIIDALFKVIDFPCWKTVHFLYFLWLKPNDINYQYSDKTFCLLKTQNITESKIEDWLKSELNSNYEITWKKTVLPSIHPSILIWLFKEPSVYKKNNKLYGEIIVLPIKNNTTYYKTPNKLSLI
jgi:hypothetical protein